MIIGWSLPTAIMLIDCSIGTDDGVIDELKKIPAVAYAYKLIGYHDIIVRSNQIQRKS